MSVLTIHSVLAEVLAEHNELIPVVNRFGIRLGVGDKTIGDLCREYRLNPDFILTVLNVYLDDNYYPEKDLPLFDAELIAAYFKQTITNYIRDLVPNIEKHLNAFIAISGPGNKELLLLHELFVQFKKELTGHIENGLSEEGNFRNELLHDLKNILIKHISSEYNQNLCYAVIFSVSSLEKDLAAHDRLCDRILRPKLKELDSARKQFLENSFLPEPSIHHTGNQKDLTKREIEILKLIIQGLLNKEIAEKLNISLNTVLTHRKKIIRKTGVKTVSGLTFYCIRNGIVSI